MDLNQGKYNILVIGKTGVGKSSFVNYFLGDKVAKTGTGSPVTERGFHEHPFELDGFPVTLYDSWGLEADKYMEWMEKFSGELNERGVDKPATEWFHSVFYCISAGSHRVEDADIAIVKQLQAEKYPVSVILTKGDMINEAQEEEMKSAIWRGLGKVNVITMSSGGKTRGGVVEPFGLDEIRQAAKDDFFASIAMRIPDHLRAMLNRKMAEWKMVVEKKIEEVGYFDDDKILKEIEYISRKRALLIKKDLQDTLNDILKNYTQFMSVAAINVGNMQFGKKGASANDLSAFDYIWVPVVAVVFSVPLLMPLLIFGLAYGKELNRQDLRKIHEENYQKFGSTMFQWIAKVENELIATRNRVRNHG